MFKVIVFMHQLQIIHFTNSKPLIKLWFYMAQDAFLGVEYCIIGSQERQKRLSGNKLWFIQSGQSVNS